MSNYVIFTDSACDIKSALLKEWGVRYINMTFHFEGEEREYSNEDMEIGDFYEKMKQGSVAKTSAINPDSFAVAFEEILKEGNDILYLAFSSGLSTTCNSAKIAAEELLEKYPNRKIIVVDTLAASAGQGLIVYLTLVQKNSGKTIEEAANYAEEIKSHIAHWVTVDDLVYLKRGGRISPTVALVGKALGIKPIIHVDSEGKLISISKSRGRKAALSVLTEKYSETAENLSQGMVYISHADCAEDAEELARMIEDKHNISVELITDIGTVIGAHAGPGTLALFFVAKER